MITPLENKLLIIEYQFKVWLSIPNEKIWFIFCEKCVNSYDKKVVNGIYMCSDFYPKQQIF